MSFFLRNAAFLLALLGLTASAPALPPTHAAPSGVEVLLLSDIHFDPFRDPDKLPQLIATPASQWRAILDAAPSPGQTAALVSLDERCHERGHDTGEPLFAASLKALHAQARSARFALIAGDLMAHGFECKYHALVPKATASEYRAFAVKTMDYVLAEVRAALPGVPVYPALGNNDSGCGDYQLDPHDAFLSASAPAFTADLSAAARSRARADFSTFGGYTAPLPFANTRLIVFDNLFASKHYAGCGGKPNPAATSESIAWLRTQLEAARAAHENLWILGHIPTGIDPYSTTRKLRNVCAGDAPEMFLSSPELASLLAEFGDVIRLAIFAHTHMDEMHLIAASAPGKPPVAVKVTPSISPINGNKPAFTLARVDAKTATLLDYRVIASNDAQGSTWSQEYSFSRTYGLPEYSATTLPGILSALETDRAAATATSQAYARNYFVGNAAALLKLFWPQYVCTLKNDTADSYRACLCPQKP